MTAAIMVTWYFGDTYHPLYLLIPLRCIDLLNREDSMVTELWYQQAKEHPPPLNRGGGGGGANLNPEVGPLQSAPQ